MKSLIMCVRLKSLLALSFTFQSDNTLATASKIDGFVDMCIKINNFRNMCADKHISTVWLEMVPKLHTRNISLINMETINRKQLQIQPCVREKNIQINKKEKKIRVIYQRVKRAPIL